jgi:hypothetical protein
MMCISKINFFQPEIWEKGSLLKEIERNLAVEDDLYASGRWKLASDLQVLEKYKSTLGGKAIETFDPNGYLAELGLPQSLTAGRSNIEMLRAFHIVKDYIPDPRYFPLPQNISAFAQKALLSFSLLSPILIKVVDHLADHFVVKKIEKRYMTNPHDPNRYGRFEEIVKGDQSDLPIEAYYFGILRKRIPQYVWDQGPHTGSINPGREGTENFGTYDIARKLGFTDSQASRIAINCYGVDIDKTHYHDPHDKTKPRITSTEGEIGDIHRHYNRSPSGAEDTRITAAKIHFDRALQLVIEGYYDSSEQELAIGLHSLQDVLSHAQLTPTTHTILGEFPDFVKYHPLAMYETAVVTENYLKKFIKGLNLKMFDQAKEFQPQINSSVPFIVGNSTPDEESDVVKKLAEFPKELITFLKNNDICIFVGNAGTKLTELGFGLDLDGDGKITPGKWVDVNQDGQKQWFEVEDQFEDGKKWDQQLAAYNHENQMIFISARVLKDPKFEEILKHEINHALDLTHQDNPQLKVKWKAYISKLYNAARRQGKIAFDELDPHEYFARSEPF